MPQDIHLPTQDDVTTEPYPYPWRLDDALHQCAVPRDLVRPLRALLDAHADNATPAVLADAWTALLEASQR